MLTHRLPNNFKRPIAFVSRTLSSAEKNYSQIEKETLACVFGVKRFHSYLFGRKFTLVTDHKPLLTLLNESRGIPTTTSNRIQRWALTLAMYSILFKFSSANALSHLPYHILFHYTIFLLEEMSESPVTVTQFHSWTWRDPILSQVVHFILSGWSRKIKENDTAPSPFFNRKWELSTKDGVVLWGSQIIIPPPGHDYILEKLHAWHHGISHMKTLSRSFVWWPGLDKDIESFVKNCSKCQVRRPSPPAAPSLPWRWPARPWFRLH